MTETKAVALSVNTARLTEFEQRRDALAPAIRKLKIATAQDRQIAAELVGRCTALLKEVDGDFEPVIANVYAAHKSLKAVHAKYRAPVLELRQIVDAEVLRDRRAQQEEANRERARVQQQEAEAEEERRIARAIEAEESGESELANEILDEVVPAVIPQVPAVEKVAGVSVRHSYGYKLVDATQVAPLGEVLSLLGRIFTTAGGVANGDTAGGEEKKRAAADCARWAKEALMLLTAAKDGARIGYLVVDDKEVGKIVRASGKKAEKIVGGILVVENEIVAH